MKNHDMTLRVRHADDGVWGEIGLLVLLASLCYVLMAV